MGIVQSPRTPHAICSRMSCVARMHCHLPQLDKTSMGRVKSG